MIYVLVKETKLVDEPSQNIFASNNLEKLEGIKKSLEEKLSKDLLIYDKFNKERESFKDKNSIYGKRPLKPSAGELDFYKSNLVYLEKMKQYDLDLKKYYDDQNAIYDFYIQNHNIDFYKFDQTTTYYIQEVTEV